MKDIGRVLLAIWLVLIGLKYAVGLNFNYDHLVIGILAIVAGVFLVVRR